MHPPVLITITGPSGTGKSHLQSLLKDHGFPALVSTTTRAPRRGERHGAAYHFVSREQFIRDLHDGRMVEHVAFDHNMYGLSARSVEEAVRAGQGIMTVVVEPQGAAQVRDYCKQHGWVDVAVFVDNPREILTQRLLERFLADSSAAAPGTAAARAVLMAASRRLISMLDNEQREWVAPAHADGQTLYDLVFARYDTGNQDFVLRAVLARVARVQSLVLDTRGGDDASIGAAPSATAPAARRKTPG